MKVKIFCGASRMAIRGKHSVAIETEINEFISSPTVKVCHISQSSTTAVESGICKCITSYSIWYEEIQQSAPKAGVLEKLLNTPITELGFKNEVWAHYDELKTVRDIVTKTDSQLLRFRGLGTRSLSKIERKLSDHGLKTGMKLP